MIPKIYERTETDFTSEGLGRLPDAVSCTVSEGRNDEYELELEYPVDGQNFGLIEVGRIIGATHDDAQDEQPFDIYRKSEPLDGVVTFYAHHISYRLNGITVMPYTAGTCAEALSEIQNYSAGQNPFTFTTDKVYSANFVNSVPRPCRAMLGGEENSILDVYGKGEYEFDKWNVTLHTNRGTARSTSIQYGKNLIAMNNEFDDSDSYTAVAPYWAGQVSNEGAEPSQVIVTLPEYYISSGHYTTASREIVVPMDCSGDFQEPPTVADLRSMATDKLENSVAWVPQQTIDIDFVALWQTEEYANVAPLQRVLLCDTVNVVVPHLDLAYRAKVIKTVYNVLLDRYDEIQLGDKPNTLTGEMKNALGTQFSDLNAKAQQNEAYAEWAAQQAQIAQNAADGAIVIADNTRQHFWYTEDGEDTGAHITEVDQDEFLAEPSMGGANILTRTTGVAIRDGLQELATFGTNGVSLYGQDGELIAHYGQTAQVGASDGFHIELDGTELGFYDGETKVAYISNNTLYIGQSVVLDEMQLGEDKWTWKIDPRDDYVYLKWIG